MLSFCFGASGPFTHRTGSMAAAASSSRGVVRIVERNISTLSACKVGEKKNRRKNFKGKCLQDWQWRERDLTGRFIRSSSLKKAGHCQLVCLFFKAGDNPQGRSCIVKLHFSSSCTTYTQRLCTHTHTNKVHDGTGNGTIGLDRLPFDLVGGSSARYSLAFIGRRWHT